MKICSIEFINHHILGSLKLDFKIQGAPAETIYLIGDNGVGKTTILKEIEDLSSNTNWSNDKTADQKIIYEIVLKGEEISTIFSVDNRDFDQGTSYFTKIIIDKNKRGWDAISAEVKGNTAEFASHSSLWNHEVKSQVFRSNYFESNPEYAYTRITGTTSLDIDVKDGAVSTYREIAQLLVDIQSQDDSDFGNWSRENPTLARTNYPVEGRTDRFARAFNEIFDKKYHGLVTTDGEKKILFKDGSRTCDIGTLSSGEKQITLRACNLLKNIDINSKRVTLLDEPEVSLHPSLQLKIIKFYKSLLSNRTQEFLGQFFISTHSPFILDKINNYTDKVIQIERKDGQTRTKDVADFFGWHDKKIITESFNLDTTFLRSGINVLLEGETDEEYFKSAINFIEKENLNIEYKWVGRTVSKGRSEFTGDTALNQTLSFSCAHPEIVSGKLVLLYDNDTKKAESNHGKVLVRSLPDGPENSSIKKGIESLLDLTHLSQPIETFWKSEEKTDDYGAKSIINKLNKMALCQHICQKEEKENQEKILRRTIDFIKQLESNLTEHYPK